MPIILQFRPSISPYKFSAVLQDQEYSFDRVRWNSRDAAWYFDLLELDGTRIAIGTKIVLGAYMCRRSNHPLFKNGALVARPANNDRSNPTFDDLGVRVQVWYFTREEVVQEIIGTLTSVGGGA